MLNLSNGDTSTCTKGVSPLLKIGVTDSIGHHFEGQRNPGNIYSSVYFSTMVGNLVLKVKYF